MILSTNKEYEKNTIITSKEHINIWEHNLSLRISLQQITDKINELPTLNSSFETNDLNEFNNNNLKNNLRNILKDTTNLLLKQTNDDFELKRKNKELKTCPTWDELIEIQNSLEVGWEEIINKWHARTHYGSEKKKASLKVFNQTIWDQIDEILQDETRVIEKSRIPKRESKRRRLSIDQSISDDNEENNEIINEYDPEVYDDRTFYSLLLKAFISNSSSSSTTSSHTLMRPEDLAALKSYKKSQSKVDRKASKGRKIKYVAHEKLKNFMFPIPTYAIGRTPNGTISTSTPTHNFFTEKEDVDRLYKSLFQ